MTLRRSSSSASASPPAIGVESTARHAHENGFNVTLAVDAMTDMTDMSLDAHVNSVTRIFPRLGETGPTEEILALLDGTRAGVPAA